MTEPTKVPAVYAARAELRKAVGTVGKDSRNTNQGWQFRGIDALQAAFLAALNSKGNLDFEVSYKLIQAVPNDSGKGYSAWVVGKLTFISLEDGSQVSFTAVGHGTDPGDKATNKAMSAALKYLLGHGLGIPVIGLSDDGDKESPVALVNGAK